MGRRAGSSTKGIASAGGGATSERASPVAGSGTGDAGARPAGGDACQSAILSLTTAYLLYIDADRRVRYVTPAVAARRGVPAADLIGRPYTDDDPQLREAFESIWRGVVESHEPGRGRVAFTREGRTRDYEFTVVPDVRPDGSLAGAVVTAHETTDLVESEREAWRLEREIERLSRVRAVLSGINEAIVRARDREALLREACEIAVNVGGYELAWLGFVDADGELRPAVHAGRGDVYLDGLVVSADERDPRGGGPIGRAIRRREPVSANDLLTDATVLSRDAALRAGFRSLGAFPLLGAQGATGAFVLYAGVPDAFSAEEERLFMQLAADLSFALDSMEADRRRAEAEERLAATAQRYRNLFEQAPVAMWMYDAETLEFLAVNNTAVELYGYSRDEFLSMTLRDIRPPEDIPALLADVSAPGDGYRPTKVWRHVRKDGTVREVEVSAHDVESAGRRARLALIIDVTERRQLDERLRQAAKIEALGQLAGGIAHDFNNLLTAVNGYAELLAVELEGDPRADSVLEIRRAGGRAAELTRQLLAFARRQRLAPRAVDVNAVIEGVTPMLGRLVGERIDVRTTLADGELVVLADPGQLEQVLVNLTVNARDAMPDGGLLEIATQRLEDAASLDRAVSGPAAHISVTDTGVGMDSETAAHAFEPFFTTKPVGQGTGLGLSTAFGIVSQSSGETWIESLPGEGTSIHILLPLGDGAPEMRPHPATAPVTRRARATVLLVEDDADVRNFAVRTLERAGYVVLVASSPKHALALADGLDEQIDVLVTDLVMPGGGGRELAERLLADRPNLRVVIMSGYDDSPGEKMPGGAAFLPKPFGPDQLAAAVRGVLDR